ncbi:MAG: AAA family ATPase [Clostridia bacterium]|nr:AAA family ATPase [Clostridia bacterium]
MKDHTIFDTNRSDVCEILNKYNISIPNNFVFSNMNIVIGSNGAGKTRFLRAIRELYHSDEKSNVMYSYFPGLSHSKSTIINDDELPLCTLYESLQETEIEFEDFLREIELHNEDYIPQLLNYHSRLQRERGEKALNTLRDTFFAISGQEIIFEANNVYVSDKNGKKSPLKEAVTLFSSGELMIFYISVFLSLQRNSNKKRIIILDEPECHLHPKALLTFIQILKDSNYFTTVWIATHSLFLIPEFEFKDIIYIDNSKIVPRNSNTYRNILNDLLGEDIDRTSQFISSLSQWQYCEYIAECFIDPDVIDIINPKDEQVLLFLDFIKNHQTIKVLDFGGGSARLGLSLKQSINTNAGKVIYEIYDKKPQYKGNEFKVYKSLQSINQKYDCIVMMNVLHEIDPKDWVTVFKEIDSLLKETGYLLFVETSILNKGEMPNKTGFLVLDSEELQVLLSSSKELTPIIIKESQKSICIPIPKKLIRNVNEFSVKSTIETLEITTLKNIKEEREKADFKTSRYYAFLSQMYINAKLYNDSTSKAIQSITTQKKVPKKLILQNLNTSSTDSIENVLAPFMNGAPLIRLSIELIKNLERIKITNQNGVAYGIISRGLKDLYDGRKTKESDLQLGWKEVLLLEKNHESKEIISLFLLSLFILGEKKSKNRINNNGYISYIKSFLGNVY